MKVIELRPDSSLLKNNFDGYKLSLEPIPVLKLENISKPHQSAVTVDADFSLLHSHLLLHNHLEADPWLTNTAYFLDSTCSIQKIQYDTSCGRLKSLQPVFRVAIPKTAESTGPNFVYNASFKFCSEKYAVLGDGVASLRILDTGDRQKSSEWKPVHVAQPLGGSGFIIKEARFAVEKGEKLIHCLILHINRVDEKFHNIVNWLTFKQTEGAKVWELSARRTIQGRGSLHYLALDPKCTAIVYSSNRQYKYTLDTVNEIIEEVSPVPELENLQVEENENNFKWSQDGEEVTIVFNSAPNSTKEQYDVKCEKSHIEVKFDGKVLLKSDIFGEIDKDLTTWSFEQDHLQVNLIKLTPELTWPYLTPGGPPMESSDDKQAELLSTAPVADLNAQMEECDYGDEGQQDEEFFIERLESSNHKPSHKVFLGSNHPLFSTTLRPGFPQAIAVRNDVDCCLWLQQASGEWSMRHEATLHAFAYVQASKRERKYLMCSPDVNLAVISESLRHLFIYKNSYSTASGLRKRTGSQLTIGQQKVVTFDGSNGEILGMSVENDIILILTENAVCCLQLSIEE